MNPVSRRQFLARTALAAASTAILTGCQTVAPKASLAKTGKLRAVVIGHTGKGNYGHGMDTVMVGHPEVELVAVADANADGLKKAQAKLKAPKAYASYHEMLEKEKPDLVSIATRWTVEHKDMALAAIKAGAHIYTEKPFTTDLAEADAILAAAKKAGIKIAVAHQMHVAQNIAYLKGELEKGLIGDLLEIRANGKQDKRAGGEDMLVLGTHLFDLMRIFAGNAEWCTARVQTQGRDITIKDARKATEGIGLVAGEDIYAQFGFAKGVNGLFVSREENATVAGGWGLELIGSKGMVKIQANIPPRIFLLKPGAWSERGQANAWERVPGDPLTGVPESQHNTTAGNRVLLDSLITAARTGWEPACNGYDGMKAVEMVMAVYQSALAKRRVSLPLKDRRHPLSSGA
ncbi:MAG TPA: Gfo/Idh/MocA family oxidoreductase [Verrucomicrobiae bacterium]